MSDGATPEERRALFRVVRGEPTGAELAALTAVLAAASAAAAAAAAADRPPPAAPDRWSDPAARLRGPLVPGPGAWQRTYWPR